MSNDIKVGDRVQAWDGDQGTVVGAPRGGYVEVDFEIDGRTVMPIKDLELVTPEPPLQPWKHLDNYLTSFEGNVRRITDGIADLLIVKNKAYGDSALNPIRVFSKSDRIEQLNVRIDDKLSRIQRGTDFEDEDTVRDLAGYLIMLLIARESE